MKMKPYGNALLMASVLSLPVFAQQAGPDISQHISAIEAGQAERVREEIPSLLARYPNNPAILYLQGLATEDGAEAVRIFQSVFDNFPKSEWADDALYRVYQFYYAIGLYRTAEIKLNQLKEVYPTSKYVTGGDAVETKHFAEEAETPSTPEPAVRDSGLVEAPAPAQDVVPAAGSFALQVGAYTLQVNAAKQKLFFEDLGYSVEIMSKVKDNRSLHTVLVGPFNTYEEARTRGVEIKQRYNIDSIVLTR